MADAPISQVPAGLDHSATGQESSAGTVTDPLATERPAWLPQGFNTPEEFRAQYDKEHPAALDPAAPDPLAVKAPEAEKPAVDPNAPPARTDDEIRASLKAAGGLYARAEYEPAALEFEKTGDVSAATLAAVTTALGVPLEYGQAFVDAQKQARQGQTAQATLTAAQTDALVADIASVAGGVEQYDAFKTWASANLPEARTKAYTDALDPKVLTANPAMAKGLLSALVAEWRAAGNQAPRDITQAANPAEVAGGADAFGSKAEMMAAMNDPRYRDDPAYRAVVERRTKAMP